MEEKKRSYQFKNKYGEAILTGGFTQIPNDLIRNLGSLKLKPTSSVVLFKILSINDGYASADNIAKETNISIGTVRRCVRELEGCGYIFRISAQGQANKFNVDGLVDMLQKIAKLRQEATHLRSKGVSISDASPMPNSHTNKEANRFNTDNNGNGYKTFENAGKKLKKDIQ